MMIWAWLAVASVLNPAVTPGAVRPLTRSEVCAIHWGTDVRHVTPAMKRAVFAAYGIPLADRRRYVIDHLIPRELAGADEIANLWPQLLADSYVKDVSEGALHRAVCAPTPTLTLAEAQDRMRHWRLAVERTN